MYRVDDKAARLHWEDRFLLNILPLRDWRHLRYLENLNEILDDTLDISDSDPDPGLIPTDPETRRVQKGKWEAAQRRRGR